VRNLRTPGPRSRHVFSDYSRDWRAGFRREAEVLRATLGVNVVAIHHIGSTSYPAPRLQLRQERLDQGARADCNRLYRGHERLLLEKRAGATI
jgi:hypothetical protein